MEQPLYYSVEEYLRIDDADPDVRHEYRDGEIIAMAGADFPHVLINANLIRHAGNWLAGTPCLALATDMRVRAVRARRYCYPDVAVVCGTPEFDPPDRQVTLTNPRVVIEVLSSSTEWSDRGEKFTRYREMASLQEYLLVAQDRPQVEPFSRMPDGAWKIGQVVTGLDGVVRVASLGIDLPMAEIYERVTFPPAVPPDAQPD